MELLFKPYKKEFDYSYSLGAYPTIELLQGRPETALAVLTSSDLRASPEISEIDQICSSHRIGILANDRLISRISAKENCYVIGVFKKYSLSLDPGRPHVVLVNPSNMGNLGTIIRTVLGFGIRDLAIIRPGLDIFDPKVIRASMGAFFRINFQYFDLFSDYRMGYPEHDLYPFMLQGKVSLNDLRPQASRPCSLIFGNEATGLDGTFLKIGTPVVIRHSDQIDSLNLPVAVGIAAYDFYSKNQFYSKETDVR
ncbi:MAG TPA: TrmH family RNA methyltransferase [Clostridiales bacterium]|nr:TrmH family RNA methyltransferase [Clostridiales bacterium]